MIFAFAKNILSSRASRRGVVLKDNWGAVLTGDVKGDVVVVNGERYTFSLHIPRVRDPVPENIGSLLTWRSRIPERLYGREAEVTQLWNWCNEPADIRVRVLCGEGGSGKTRLAFEFAELLRAKGWQAGQLTDPTRPVAFPVSKQGVLLIIDYPEQYFSAVAALLRQIRNSELPGVRLRILLLSRNREAMQTLVNAQVEPFHSAPIQLRPLSSPHIAWAIFQDGWRRMAELRQYTQPLSLDEAGFAAWLQQSPAHAQPLTVLAFALNLMYEPGAIKLSRTEILQRLVERESDRLREEVERHRLQHEGTLLLKGLAAIPGRFTAAQIDALRAQVPHGDIEVPTSVQLQRTMLWHEGALQELQPDLLASMLAHRVIRAWLSAPNAAGPWVWAALTADAPSEAELRERLRRIARLSADRPGFAEQVHDVIVDALVALVSRDEAKAKIIDTALAEEAPFGRTLQPLAIWSARQVVRVWEARALDSFAASAPHLAMSLDSLARRLADSGNAADCAATLRRATQIRRQLADTDFARYGRNLASSLSTLSVALADADHTADCLEAMHELVQVWQRLAADDFNGHAPDLAASLTNLATRLRNANDGLAAADATRRAVAVHEQLAARDFAAYGMALASSLSVLAGDLARAADQAGSIVALRRAAAAYEWLVTQKFSTYAPDLLQCLANLLEACDAEGDQPGAVAAARRVVEIREQQVTSNFAAHAPQLATSLRDLWRELAKSGDRVGTLAAMKRAAEIRDQLANGDFEPHAAGLAATLNNLSVHLADSGDCAGSLAAQRRAIVIYERLAEQDPSAHTADLATSLHNLSVLIGRLGSASDDRDGIAALQRAVELRESLAAGNFAEHAPALAASLNNLSVELADSGDRAAGLAAMRRVVELYERLAQDAWSIYAPSLALSLNNLSIRLSDAGDGPASLAAARRAAAVLEELASTEFSTFAPELVRRLCELAIRLGDAQDASDGVAAMVRAVEIAERLSSNELRVQVPQLVTSIHVLARRCLDRAQRPDAARLIRRALSIISSLNDADTRGLQWQSTLMADEAALEAR